MFALLKSNVLATTTKSPDFHHKISVPLKIFSILKTTDLLHPVSLLLKEKQESIKCKEKWEKSTRMDYACRREKL